MKTSASFPYLIDTMLGELEQVSVIRIDCMTAEENNNPDSLADIRVAAVNGMYSALEFMNLLRHLKSEVLMRFREVVPCIAPADLDTFIDLALRRVRRILRTALVEGVATEEERFGLDACWSINQLQCFLEDVESDDPLVYMEAMTQTQRQAWIYHLELKRLEERISLFAGATINLSVNMEPLIPGKQGSKFKLTCTVAFIGAFLRIICDRNLLDNPNIAELCRAISRAFSTSRQENLGSKSIRNNFDNPSTEVLEELQQELRICDKYITSLIRRQQN